MIMQALYEYYRRRDDLPRFGMELKEFQFLIIIQQDGTFSDLVNVQTVPKKGTPFLVPRSFKRPGTLAKEKPFLLWDTIDFVLGESGKGNKASEKDRATALEKRANFAARLENLPDELKRVEDIKAVLEFYRKGEYAKVPQHGLWQELLESGSSLTFRLCRHTHPVASCKEIKDFVAAITQSSEKNAPKGRCLITGNHGELARLMTPTPIKGNKRSASFVGLQKKQGYDSYGKEQCFNAPMSLEAEFACSTALNALRKSSKTSFLLGGITVLFWTQKEEKNISLCKLLLPLVREDKDDPHRSIAAVRAMLESAYSGRMPRDEMNNRFYFLGLAPNAARISVAFWRTGTVRELCGNLERHLLDFEIVANERYQRPTTLSGVLDAVTMKSKNEKKLQYLENDFFDAVISGTTYPVNTFIRALNRIRAAMSRTDPKKIAEERKSLQLRIAIIKAYLNRKNRLYKQKNKEITMALDPENPSIGYQCGRLFAVLEKAQQDAAPGINATIGDRFYGAASSTPVTVFSRILTLNRYHLEKVNDAGKVYFKKMIGEIIERIPNFPAHLSLEEQGLFAIGYYHQNRHLWSKKNTETATEENKV